MILSKLSGMAGHGSFPMKVVGSPMTNNLVCTNHFHFLSIFTFSFLFCNLYAVVNLGGCDRLFSLQLLRTLPVADIH